MGKAEGTMPHPLRPLPNGPHSERGQHQALVTMLGDTRHSDRWECPQAGPSRGSSRSPFGPTRSPPSPFLDGAPGLGNQQEQTPAKAAPGPNRGTRVTGLSSERGSEITLASIETRLWFYAPQKTRAAPRAENPASLMPKSSSVPGREPADPGKPLPRATASTGAADALPNRR